MILRNVFIGIDSGFATAGVAVVEFETNALSNRLFVVDFQFFSSDRSDKKRTLLETEDNVRRAKELADFYSQIFAKFNQKPYRIVGIGMESMSWPPHKMSCAVMGIGFGVLIAEINFLHIPLLQASPQAVKKFICQKHSATKEALQSKLNNHPDLSWKPDDWKITTSKTKREHPYDALAVAMTCSRSDLVLSARRMVE